jgi:aryl-alcohol dehydrogenase-like predicted oxidoreductase/Pyruvate/2-oxoacid:ferredoxin oxidoreductase delta subunit
MKKIVLGNTNLEVTELCFGALPFGPLQKNLAPEESAEILSYALDLGVNFIDTAQMYKTYEPIKIALRNRKNRPIIATKTHCLTYEDTKDAVKEALKGMGVDYIDIFHLHSARYSTDVFNIKKDVLKCLKEYKEKGIIKAIGISTHSVKVVEKAAYRDDIDVVFPLINKVGRGILEGTVDEMKDAINLCEREGKGIYLMKVLGGGTLIDDFKESVEFARNLSDNYSIAIGMVSKEEVLFNVKYFNGEQDLDGIINTKNKKEIKVFEGVCVSCGSCIKACHSNAISFNDKEKAFIDQSKCIQCGYCIASCPSFAIRVV